MLCSISGCGQLVPSLCSWQHQGVAVGGLMLTPDLSSSSSNAEGTIIWGLPVHPGLGWGA